MKHQSFQGGWEIPLKDNPLKDNNIHEHAILRTALCFEDFILIVLVLFYSWRGNKNIDRG